DRQKQIQKRPPKKKKQAAATNSTAKMTATRRSGFNLGKLGRRKQRPYAHEINVGDYVGTAQAGLCQVTGHLLHFASQLTQRSTAVDRWVTRSSSRTRLRQEYTNTRPSRRSMGTHSPARPRLISQ